MTTRLLISLALLSLTACDADTAPQTESAPAATTEARQSAAPPAVAQTQPLAAADNPPALSIGLLDNAGYRYQDGAGCAFLPRDAHIDYDDESTWKYLFLSSWNSTPEPGWVSVDGEVREVELMANSGIQGVPGDSVWMHFQGPQLDVHIEGRYTEAHDGGGGDVEGVMRVEHAGRSSSVEINGDCGS